METSHRSSIGTLPSPSSPQIMQGSMWRLFLTNALLLWASCAWSQTTKPSTGIAVLDIGNRRDINHERNAGVREKLMRAAVLDAVERVAELPLLRCGVRLGYRSEAHTSEV